MPEPLSLKRFTSVNRKPLQQNLELPSTSSDPTLNIEYLPHTSMDVVKDVLQKENIDPDTVHAHNMLLGNSPLPMKNINQNLDSGALMHEQVPFSSISEIKYPQNLGEKRVGRKIAKKKVFLTNVGKELHQKLIAPRIKRSKIKNKVRKQ